MNQMTKQQNSFFCSCSNFNPPKKKSPNMVPWGTCILLQTSKLVYSKISIYFKTHALETTYEHDSTEYYMYVYNNVRFQGNIMM